MNLAASTVPRVRCALLCLLAGPALAQSDDTYWSMQARFTELSDQQDYSVVGPLQGQGNGTFGTTGPAWTLDFKSEAVASAPTRTLRSYVSVDLDLPAGWGSAEVIGTSRASFSDTFTVAADPGFTGGYLEFDWRFGGFMTTGVGKDGRDPSYSYLGLFIWENYMKAELFVTGDLARTTVSTKDLSETTVEVPEAARIFADYMPLQGGLRYEPEGNDLRSDVDPSTVTGQRVRVPVQAGVSQQFTFNLATGTNLGLYNVDYYGIKSDSSLSYNNTATMDGVRLYDADGNFYDGAWTLQSGEGIDYPMLPQVPEPGTVAMWLAGLGLLGGVRARQRRG